MTGVFQPNVFQNNVFQVDVQQGAGGWIVKHHAGDELKHTGANFSRRRFEEFMAAEQAIRDAKRAAEDAKKQKATALRKAAKAAKEVLEAVELERAGEARAEIGRMTDSLKAAAGAKKTADVLAQAKQAISIAESIRAYLEEQEDEEEAVTLLLMA